MLNEVDLYIVWFFTNKNFIYSVFLQRTDLKRLFQFCLQGLSELNKIGPPIPSETAKLFKKFLIIAEQVLTWNFQFAMLCILSQENLSLFYFLFKKMNFYFMFSLEKPLMS